MVLPKSHQPPLPHKKWTVPYFSGLAVERTVKERQQFFCRTRNRFWLFLTNQDVGLALKRSSELFNQFRVQSLPGSVSGFFGEGSQPMTQPGKLWVRDWYSPWCNQLLSNFKKKIAGSGWCPRPPVCMLFVLLLSASERCPFAQNEEQTEIDPGGHHLSLYLITLTSG